MCEYALWGILQCPTATSHCRETLVVLPRYVCYVDIFLGFGLFFGNHYFFFFIGHHVPKLVFAIFLDLSSIVFVVPFDLLLHGVKTLCVCGIHLDLRLIIFSGGFLCCNGLVHEILEVGYSFDVFLGRLLSSSDLDNLPIKLVKLCDVVRQPKSSL